MGVRKFTIVNEFESIYWSHFRNFRPWDGFIGIVTFSAWRNWYHWFFYHHPLAAWTLLPRQEVFSGSFCVLWIQPISTPIDIYSKYHTTKCRVVNRFLRNFQECKVNNYFWIALLTMFPRYFSVLALFKEYDQLIFENNYQHNRKWKLILTYFRAFTSIRSAHS